MVSLPVQAQVANNGNVELFLNSNTFPPETDSMIFLNGGPTVSPTLNFTGQIGSQTGLPGTPTVDFATSSNTAGTCGAAACGAVDVANGFATGAVPHSGGADVNSLSITIPGDSFGDFLFSTQLLGPPLVASGDQTLTVTAMDGTTQLGSFNVDNLTEHDADQMWKILAEGGNTITDLVLTSSSGFKEVKQFQVSSLASGPVPEIPIPGTLPLLGSGLVGLWGWTRRRKTTVKLAA